MKEYKINWQVCEGIMDIAKNREQFWQNIKSEYYKTNTSFLHKTKHIINDFGITASISAIPNPKGGASHFIRASVNE